MSEIEDGADNVVYLFKLDRRERMSCIQSMKARGALPARTPIDILIPDANDSLEPAEKWKDRYAHLYPIKSITCWSCSLEPEEGGGFRL